MASGRPDWFGTIVAAGKYDDTYLPIALDAKGFITATMKGAYDAVLKTIAVDSDGVMKANIAVQDLATLIMRPKYGAATMEAFSVACPGGQTTTLLTINAMGMIYEGHIYTPTIIGHATDQPKLYIDDALIGDDSYHTLNGRNIIHPQRGSIYLTVFNDKDHRYCVGIGRGNSFESKVELKYYNAGAEEITVYGNLIYASI